MIIKNRMFHYMMHLMMKTRRMKSLKIRQAARKIHLLSRLELNRTKI